MDLTRTEEEARRDQEMTNVVEIRKEGMSIGVAEIGTGKEIQTEWRKVPASGKDETKKAKYLHMQNYIFKANE